MIVCSQGLLDSYLAGNSVLRNDQIGYMNLLQTAVLTPSSTLPGFNSSTLRNGLTQIYWRPSSLPATLDIAPTETQQVNYCGLAGHNLADAGITVYLQASTGAGYFDIAAVTPETNEPIVFLFEPANYPTYRLRFEDPGALGVLFSLAVVYLGQSLEMERGPDFGYAPIELSRDDRIMPQMSGSGGFIGSVVEKRGNRSSISYSNLTNAWYRRYFDPFVDAAVSRPFFHISLPEPDQQSDSLELDFAADQYAVQSYFASKNGGVSFVRIPQGQNISPTKSENDGRFNVSFEMEGLARG